LQLLGHLERAERGSGLSRKSATGIEAPGRFIRLITHCPAGNTYPELLFSPRRWPCTGFRDPGLSPDVLGPNWRKQRALESKPTTRALSHLLRRPRPHVRRAPGILARPYDYSLLRWNPESHQQIRAHACCLTNQHHQVAAIRFAERPLPGQRTDPRLHYQTQISRIEPGRKRGTC